MFDKSIRRKTYAAIRFGYGLPLRAAPGDAAGLLDALGAPDRIAARLPLTSFDEGVRGFAALQKARSDQRKGVEGADAVAQRQRTKLNEAYVDGLSTALSRAAETDNPFRERLVWFWADHFTVPAITPPLAASVMGYIEDAIRPNVAGRFADLLKAAALHPAMLVYLDQNRSKGPNSRVGRRRAEGLNENLAREILELHTLGVDGPYSQTDVTQFAELLTGLWFSFADGFRFRPGWAEPGPETVLGRSYGADGDGGVPLIESALEDSAAHPATAQHIATKLAVHFVSDTPDPDLVAHMNRAYRSSDGRLAEVYAAMLQHPAAWRGFGAKAKRPFDLLASGLRALGVKSERLTGLEQKQARRFLIRPLALMGQPFLRPPGPDGWPEEAQAWITPQGLAARIGWAKAVATALAPKASEPRDLATRALDDAASPLLLFAADAAETRAEGLAIVLSSAEFNRR